MVHSSPLRRQRKTEDKIITAFKVLGIIPQAKKLARAGPQKFSPREVELTAE